MLDDRRASGLMVTIESRALKRSLGPTAWAVLEDVALDAVPREGRWLATTSTRRVADHLGLTPGTVARALARLCTGGIVHREDRREAGTGRFGESVYVVAPLAALRPCADPPHTARRDMETPGVVRPDTVRPNTAMPPEEDRHTYQAPDRQPGSSSRRRATDPAQRLLLGDDALGTSSVAFNLSTPTTTNPLSPNPQTPTTHNPKLQNPYNTQPPNPTTQRPSNTCQPFGQASPGRASC